MATLMKIEGLVIGAASPYDGEYVKEWDPGRGEPGEAWLVTTRNPAEAKHYARAAEALDDYERVDPRQPTRADGQPNRPLTAFSISFDTWEPPVDGITDEQWDILRPTLEHLSPRPWRRTQNRVRAGNYVDIAMTTSDWQAELIVRAVNALPPAGRTAPYYASKEDARAGDVMGWNLRCHHCGSWGATWARWQWRWADLSSLAVCPSCKNAIEFETSRHVVAIRELARVNYIGGGSEEREQGRAEGAALPVQRKRARHARTPLPPDYRTEVPKTPDA